MEQQLSLKAQNTRQNDITELGIGVTLPSLAQTMSATNDKRICGTPIGINPNMDKRDDVKYNRKDWKHWSAQNGHLLNTREQA